MTKTGHRMRRASELPGQVHDLIVACQGRRPGQEEIAGQLAMSARTLKRALRRHGLSFRGLLDRVGFARARVLLAGAPMSIDEIALQLGYSSGANFSRAFVRWCGETPGRFRERGLEQALDAGPHCQSIVRNGHPQRGMAAASSAAAPSASPAAAHN